MRRKSLMYNNALDQRLRFLLGQTESNVVAVWYVVGVHESKTQHLFLCLLNSVHIDSHLSCLKAHNLGLVGSQ